MGMGLNGLEMLTPTSLGRNLLLGDLFSHPLYPSILLYPFHLPLLPARLQPQQQSSTLSLPKIQVQFKVLNALPPGPRGQGTAVWAIWPRQMWKIMFGRVQICRCGFQWEQGNCQ